MQSGQGVRGLVRRGIDGCNDKLTGAGQRARKIVVVSAFGLPGVAFDAVRPYLDKRWEAVEGFLQEFGVHDAEKASQMRDLGGCL